MLRRYAALVWLLILVGACSSGPGGPSASQPGTTPPTASLVPEPAAHIPGWCGGASADPQTLLCIWMVNRSNVDMAVVDSASWGLIAACSSATSSGAIPPTAWGFEIYRAVPGSVTGPVLGAFRSTQVSGDPPYLIEVSIGLDQSVSISQQGSLPEDLGTPPGTC